MSAPKFTPGPWFADVGDKFGAFVWRLHPSRLYENGGDVAGEKPLAHASAGWYEDGQEGFQVSANARLIAAAPDLYAALSRIVEGDNSEAAFQAAVAALGKAGGSHG